MNGFERVPAEVAYQTSSKNKASRMPRLDMQDSRIGIFASPAIQPSFRLEPGESVFTIGSCFARRVEEFLKRQGYHVPMLDFHVPPEELFEKFKVASGMLNKYTPHSMTVAVRGAFEGTDPEKFLIEVDGGYLDMHFNTDVPVSKERGIERRMQLYELERNAIRQSRIVIVTLGLIESWLDTYTGLYLNQTPKWKMVRQFPDRFEFEVLSPIKTIDAVQELMGLLRQHGPRDQRVMLTVSPIPIGRTFTNQDVLIANTYSKSVLRTAAEVVARSHDHVDYFPSFETVMLSRREDTWMPDAIHVTADVVRHNVNTMLAAYS